MFQVIYASQPFGYDDAMLLGILFDARRCNKRDNITGALICRDDIYLQLLEGPESAVRAAYARIYRDNRHVAPKLLLAETVAARMFGKWSMRHDPAKSIIWSRQEVGDGIANDVTPQELRSLFVGLAAMKPQEQ